MDTANNGSSDDESEAEPMDVEDDAVYAKRQDDDMEASGPDKGEPEKMANADWGQLGETTKSKENRENFVRDTAETKKYEKAKRSDFVRECRTGVQQRKREWKKAKQGDGDSMEQPILTALRETKLVAAQELTVMRAESRAKGKGTPIR